MPSTSGSRILEGYLSPFDATVVARSRAAGLVPLATAILLAVLGQLRTPETTPVESGAQ